MAQDKAFTEYINALPPPQRAEFERIQKIVKEVVPGADEVISYGIPTWKYKGKYLIYFAAFPNHLSIYPVRNEVLEGFKGRLGEFKVTAATLRAKGTLQFTPDNPVPEVLIKHLVTERYKSLAAKP